MSDDLNTWAARHGVSASAMRDLRDMLGCYPAPAELRLGAPRSESHVQSLVRLEEARRYGTTLWRNNSGAGFLVNPDGSQSFVRFGLANESEQMNAKIKSPDLVGWRPVVITHDHVGQTIAQTVLRECKAADWTFKGSAREVAQERFLALARADGADARFTNGREYS